MIKFVVFGDLHEKIISFKQILNKIKKFELDCIVSVGDIGDYNYFKKIADLIKKELNIPFLYVKGNWDEFAVGKKLNNNSFELHNSIKNINGWNFIGHNWCHSNYFGEELNTEIGHKWSLYSNDYYKSNEFSKLAQIERRKSLSKILSKVDKNKIILISHAGFLFENPKPQLHFFGHMHKQKAGNFRGVIKVNCGCADNGEFILTEIDNEIKINLFNKKNNTLFSP